MLEVLRPKLSFDSICSTRIRSRSLDTGVLGKPGRWKSSKSRPDYPDSSGLPLPSGLPKSYLKPNFLFKTPNYFYTKDLA